MEQIPIIAISETETQCTTYFKNNYYWQFQKLSNTVV